MPPKERSTNFPWDEYCEERTYECYYKKYGFEVYKELDLAKADETFENYTDITDELLAIEAPLLTVFPYDDPVLSNSLYTARNQKKHYHRQPQRIVKTINTGKAGNPNIIWMTPDYGSHMGYFLDTEWLRHSLRFFKKGSKESPSKLNLAR